MCRGLVCANQGFEVQQQETQGETCHRFAQGSRSYLSVIKSLGASNAEDRHLSAKATLARVGWRR